MDSPNNTAFTLIKEKAEPGNKTLFSFSTCVLTYSSRPFSMKVICSSSRLNNALDDTAMFTVFVGSRPWNKV